MNLKKRVTEALGMAGGLGSSFDPSTIPHEGAQRTSWTPLKRGGTNFKTHRFVATPGERAEFRAARSMQLFAGVFVGMGLLVLGLVAFVPPDNVEGPFWVAPLISILFVVVGLGMFWGARVRFVFDLPAGTYWRGRKEPTGTGSKDAGRLADVMALQILPELVRGSKQSFWSYELNLVLRDGSRINVTDHGNLPSLRQDAAALSQLLGRPVWDAAERTLASAPIATPRTA